MFVVILAAMIIGLYLIWVGGWFIAAIGIAAILSALAYSGGPFPLASHGLGDLFVFIFFGLAAVVGTYHVQALQVTLPAIIAAIPVGTLTVAIIIANNLRDIETDARVGKRTLAVMLGANGARVEYVAMLVIAYAIPILFYALGWASFWTLAPFLSLPLAVTLVRDLYAATQPREQIALLAATARLDLIFSALFALGLVLR
jgi:1,4-dihydroxy-2-naphthoate octaprenyltransferase